MSSLRLIIREIAHRWVNFLCSLLAVSLAVGLFVAVRTTGQAYRRETRRLMVNMGQNLRIIPKESSLDEFWSKGFSEATMPEEYVQRFAEQEGYSYTHLTAMLHRRVVWRDMHVILTGILPEVLPPDRLQQKPMTFSVEPGTAYVGFEVAKRLGITEGGDIDLFGTPLHVVRCLSESGSDDDIRIYANLHDVQGILELPGRINEIKALECLCIIEASATPIDPRVLAQQQLAEILPEGQVVLVQGIADIRQKQRAAMEGFLALLLPFTAIVCGVWVGLLAMMNVRDRARELAILRALGFTSIRVAALFIAKALVLGIVGAAAGFIGGTAVALGYGPDIFKVTARAIRPEFTCLGWAMIAAPAFAIVASFIPVAQAVTQDPVEGLRRE